MKHLRPHLSLFEFTYLWSWFFCLFLVCVLVLKQGLLYSLDWPGTQQCLLRLKAHITCLPSLLIFKSF